MLFICMAAWVLPPVYIWWAGRKENMKLSSFLEVNTQVPGRLLPSCLMAHPLVTWPQPLQGRLVTTCWKVQADHEEERKWIHWEYDPSLRNRESLRLWVAQIEPCGQFLCRVKIFQFLHPDSTRAFEDFTSPLVCLTLCSWQVGKSRTLGSPGTSGLKQPNWGGALPAGNSGGPERFLEGSLTMHFRTLWSRNMHSQDLLRHKD